MIKMINKQQILTIPENIKGLYYFYKEKKIFSKKTIELKTSKKMNWNVINSIIEYLLSKNEIKEHKVDTRTVYEYIG